MSSSPLNYVIEEPVDYSLYEGSSWNDIDGFLEQSILNEHDRKKEKFERIKKRLEERERKKKKNQQSIKEEIRRQKNRLETARRGAELDVQTIRKRLTDLYRELREERRRSWEDKRYEFFKSLEVMEELDQIKEAEELENLI